jgi:hypothetical protein
MISAETSRTASWRRDRRIALRYVGFWLAAVMVLSGCSSFGSLGSSTPPPATPGPDASTAPAPSDTSFTSRVKSLFSGSSSSLPPPKPTTTGATSSEFDCPTVDYRQGAALYAVNEPGSDASALNLRYQASFTQNARECFVRGTDVNIKVGVQGRIVVGPAGAPAQVEIPVRYALVREGLQAKVIWTKLFVVPVTMPPGQTYVPFLHVEEEMTVPIPSTAELEAYIVYIGFDPDGLTPAKPTPKKKSPPRIK